MAEAKPGGRSKAWRPKQQRSCNLFSTSAFFHCVPVRCDGSVLLLSDGRSSRRACNLFSCACVQRICFFLRRVAHTIPDRDAAMNSPGKDSEPRSAPGRHSYTSPRHRERELTLAAHAHDEEGARAMERILHGKIAHIWRDMNVADRMRMIQHEETQMDPHAWKRWYGEEGDTGDSSPRSAVRAARRARGKQRLARPSESSEPIPLASPRAIPLPSFASRQVAPPPEQWLLSAYGQNQVTPRRPPSRASSARGGSVRGGSARATGPSPVCAEYLPRHGLSRFRAYGNHSYYVREPAAVEHAARAEPPRRMPGVLSQAQQTVYFVKHPRIADRW